MKPDLSYVEAAEETFSKRFQKVEHHCCTRVNRLSGVAQTWPPIIDELGLIGEDVEIAYCPERFNPGDPAHGVIAESLVAQIQKLVKV